MEFHPSECSPTPRNNPANAALPFRSSRISATRRPCAAPYQGSDGALSPRDGSGAQTGSVQRHPRLLPQRPPPRRNSPGKPDTVVTAWDRALPAIGCRGLAAGRSPYTADPRHSRSPDIVGAAERDLAVAARRFSQAVHVRRAAGVPADAGSVGPPRGIVTALSSGAVSAC
jgi:hypothetical protein